MVETEDIGGRRKVFFYTGDNPGITISSEDNPFYSGEGESLLCQETEFFHKVSAYGHKGEFLLQSFGPATRVAGFFSAITYPQFYWQLSTFSFAFFL